MTKPLGEEIRAQLRRLGGEPGPGAAAEAWAQAVGPQIATNAWPARVQADGTLVVHVRDAIWGFELTQRAAEIAARLPGRPRLRFLPGPLPTQDAPPTRPVPNPTAEQAREALAIAAAITDPELRESVARTITAALARHRPDHSV